MKSGCEKEGSSRFRVIFVAESPRQTLPGLALEAADAWDRYLAHVQKYFHPDLGWNRRAPDLDAITERSGRAAGGAYWVETCSESDLQWARKRFIESYTLTHETGQNQNLLTRGEAKKILESLTAAPPGKTTAAANLQKQGYGGSRRRAHDCAGYIGFPYTT